MEVEDGNIYSQENLHNCSYRFLQKISKSMHLPSNVKKDYLIELILTKRYCSESELAELIEVIKANRKQSSTITTKKKEDLVGTSEKTKQNKSPSPMITSTPKRKIVQQPFFLKDCEKMNEYTLPNQSNTLSHQILSPTTSINESGRILRSSHLKKLNNNVHNYDYFGSTDAENTMSEKVVHHKATLKGKTPAVKMNSKSLIRRPENNMVVSKNFYMPGLVKKQGRHTVEVNNRNSSLMTPRALNSLYSLWPDPKSYRSNVSVKILNVKQSNGKVSKIRALVRKRESINSQRFNNKRLDLNTEPLMEVHLPNDDNNYLNDSPLHVDEHENNVIEEYKKGSKLNEFNTDSLYCKDINGELAYYKQVANRESVRTRILATSDEAFNTVSTTSKNWDVTQPLHVETNDYWQKSYDYTPTNSDLDILDNVYISNCQYDINKSLLKIATETDSSSSSSTSGSSGSSPVMVDQPSGQDINQYITPVDTYLLNDINDVICNQEKEDTVSELFKFSQILNSYTTEQEDNNTSMSSLDESQESGGNISIDDVMKDAIDIINKDGFQGCFDGIGNDFGVQCVFCSWIGPQALLENHVKDEHSHKIKKSLINECVIKFNLGYLMQSQVWLSEVVEYGSILYVVCLKYEDPDSLMATIAILTPNSMKGRRGVITIYNKVSGEPYMWEGLLQPLSPNMPHFNELDGLNLQLSTLNLIPNSANLKLVNRELVNDSPNKVVVGQPELDSINIELLISIV